MQLYTFSKFGQMNRALVERTLYYTSVFSESLQIHGLLYISPSPLMFPFLYINFKRFFLEHWKMVQHFCIR